MWRALLNGVFIRWCACLTAVLTTVLAPRWIGANEFGIAVTVMAIPIFIQGLCEPIVSTLSIAHLNSRSKYEGLAKVRNDLGLISVLGAVAALLFAWRVLPADSQVSPRLCGLFAAVFLLSAMVNTWLMGLAYALQEHAALMRAFASASIVQLLLLWSLKSFGSAAFLLSLIGGQGASFALLWSCRPVRNGWKELWRAERDRSAPPDYVTILSLRTSLLLLNTGTVILAGTVLAPAQVAAFRISLAVAGAMNYLVPLNPQVLQATLTGSDGPTRRSVQWLLAAAFGMSAAFSAALYAGRSQWLPLLLPDQTVSDLDGKVFLALPFFLLIQPLSSYLFATQQAWMLRWGTLGCALAFAAGAVRVDPGSAFAGGAVAHVGVILGLTAWPARGSSRSQAKREQLSNHAFRNQEIAVRKAG